MIELRRCPRCGGALGGRYSCGCYGSGGGGSSDGLGVVVFGLVCIAVVLSAMAFVAYCLYRSFTAGPDAPFFEGKTGQFILEIGKILGGGIGLIVGGLVIWAAAWCLVKSLKLVGVWFHKIELNAMIAIWWAILINVPTACFFIFWKANTVSEPVITTGQLFVVSTFIPAWVCMNCTMLVDTLGKLLWLNSKAGWSCDYYEIKGFDLYSMTAVLSALYFGCMSLILVKVWHPYTWIIPLAILFVELCWLFSTKYGSKK